MPPASKTEHREVKTTNFKFQTYDSPASEDIMWQDGRNLWINPRGYTERRPGFSLALEGTPVALTGEVQRLFSWRRWDEDSSGATRGKFYVMASTLSPGGLSSVYKLEVGTDASFVLLHSSFSADPYDYVTSNNYVYFSNGSDCYKWNGTDLNLWGIVPPATAPVVVPVGSSSTGYTSRPSRANNPNGFSTPEAVWDGTTATGSTMQVSGSSGGWFTALNPFVGERNSGAVTSAACSWSGFSVIPGTVSALSLSVLSYMNCGTDSAPLAYIDLSYSTDGGVSYNTIYRMTGSGIRSGVLDTVTLDPATDLSLLVVKAELYDPHEHAAFINVYEIYLTATSAATTSATTGYSFCYTYGSSVTGHESSPSLLSLDTGAVNANALDVSVIASTDPQVNQIRVYRNTDGGSVDPVEMQEITGSPFPNVNATYRNADSDVDLGLRVAPAAYRNDPPKPMRGLIRSEISGRICGFSGHTFFYSGQEEIGFGVPEESWPGGLDGNYRPMGQEIGGIGDLPDGPFILLPDKIERLLGDTLDTFRWRKMADKRGCREPGTVTSSEGLVIWRDTSKKFFSSDGVEIGYALRNLLKSIPSGSCQICVHTGGEFNWICVLDSDAGRIYTYDIDQDKWNVPWTVAATCIASVEIAAGEYALLASIGGVVYRLVEGTYTDAGSPYSAYGIENLWPLAAEGKPDWTGTLDYVGIEHGTVAPTSVKILTDDATDAADSQWIDITANACDPFKRKQGTKLLQTNYTDIGKSCRRLSIRLDWGAVATNFYFFTQDVGYHQVGS